MTDTPYISARRSRSVAAALLALGTFSLAACSDAPVAPRAAAAPLPAPSALASLTYATGGVNVTAYSVVNGVTYMTAVVDPRTTVVFGGDDSKTVIPAYSICNPLTSAYGPAHWDAPCSPATLPMTFRVKTWTDRAGNSRVEFFPDVRFSPSKVVGLYLKSSAATTAATPSIDWCRTGATTCENEGRTDGSLATQRDPYTGFVYRRVKHFSGYMVTVGIAGDDTPTDSTQTDGGW